MMNRILFAALWVQISLAMAYGAAAPAPHSKSCPNLSRAEESRLREGVGSSNRIFEGTVTSVQETPDGVILAGVVQQFQVVSFKIEEVFKGEWPDQSIDVSYMIGVNRGLPTHAGWVLNRKYFKAGRRLIVFTFGDKRVFSGGRQNVETGLTLPASSKNRLCLAQVLAEK